VDEANAIRMKTFGVGYNFVEALGLELTRGRSLSEDKKDGKNYIINEAAAKILQLRNPLGELITVKGETGMVVGVVEDFLFSDIEKGLPPAVLYIEQDNINYMLIKLSSSENYPILHKQFKEQWNVIAPDLPFECKTLEQIFGEFFEFVYSIVGFINFIGYAAIFFSCLGLLGLASYMVERRTKEIGIRKALGASVLSVTWCLIREYVIMIVIANAIILPAVYLVWRWVLQQGILFITDIGFWTYFFAAFITLFIALIAVSSQTFKAARANPVNSLRYE
jgi:ABC-type antimicrobial peptide transport system permease subunit